MIATIVISISAFVLIALSHLFFPKIRIKSVSISTYWVIALVVAIIFLATSLAPITEVLKELTSSSKINPAKILILFFSMTLISIMLDEFGLFQYLAGLAIKAAKGNQYALFLSLYGLVAVLTIFTSNDIVILTLTPFICFFCKRTHVNPLPYLIAEFTAANTWSLMLVIGNPTNIFLATNAGIGFIDYLKTMALPSVGAGLVELFVLILLFKNKLKEPITDVDSEKPTIESKRLLIVGIIHLVVCLVFLVISGYINLEMWLISLICSVSLFVFTFIFAHVTSHRVNFAYGALKRLPYPLIPFFLSMFVIVVAINHQGIAMKIATFFGANNTIWIYGYSSFLASNAMNNIPMSILYAKLTENLTGPAYLQAVYASIVGSNIGAFLTPMGALAGIMFTELLSEHDVKFTFVDFVNYGTVVAIPTITIALALLTILI